MVKIIKTHFNKITSSLDKTELHVIVNHPELLEVIRDLPLGYVSDFFKSKFIIHAFSFLNNREKGFAHEIHRDQRFYSGNIPVMLNMIVMLDDFTEENGATWVMDWFMVDKPDERYFKDNAIQRTGKAGDILIFDGNLWHKSGENKTGKNRRCFAITFTKSCMKQLIDYPKIFGSLVPEDLKQILGYDSRVPQSMEEWNGERTYKKDQD